MPADDEVIARQARRIMELEDAVRQFQEGCEAIRMRLICIGGPLNDNVLFYSKEQLAIFFRIQDTLNDMPEFASLAER